MLTGVLVMIIMGRLCYVFERLGNIMFQLFHSQDHVNEIHYKLHHCSAEANTIKHVISQLAIERLGEAYSR